MESFQKRDETSIVRNAVYFAGDAFVVLGQFGTLYVFLAAP